MNVSMIVDLSRLNPLIFASNQLKAAKSKNAKRILARKNRKKSLPIGASSLEKRFSIREPKKKKQKMAKK